MLGWKDFALLQDSVLGIWDVAEVNLACAAGLPGSEHIDLAFCRQELDNQAKDVREDLALAEACFRHHPHHWDNSWARCRTHLLVRVLLRHGVRYNPAKMDEDAPSTPDGSFIHGVLQGEGGTCASIPVVVAAVGRRLGFPIKLVKAKCHLFARWEGEGERFNIAVNNTGFDTPWPAPRNLVHAL